VQAAVDLDAHLDLGARYEHLRSAVADHEQTRVRSLLEQRDLRDARPV
jgi:hypothetical protein